MNTDTTREQIGVVAIGRNEGKRLERCLRSAVGADRVVVYVDSGSSDDSVTFARSLGVEVVELDTAPGFTAARARNAGFRQLLKIAPAVRYVQFIDGDCELADGWITSSWAHLEENSRCAAVCGRRREIDANKNLYHLLTDMEWDTATGETKYCGGDALMRVAAFEEVHGFCDSLIAGEEPELCVRLRAAGWTISRIDHEMTLHDIRMDSWRQWWKRAVRAGHAYAEGATLHGAPPERHWVKERRSILVWGLAFPVLAIALAWPTWGMSVVFLAVAYAALIAKATLAINRQRNTTFGNSLTYAIHCVLAKIPQACGAVLFYVRALTGRKATLVEYKQPHLPQGDRRNTVPVTSSAR